MATYVYRCNRCSNAKSIEIQHEMKFVGKENELPWIILQQITCSKHGLKSRIPQEPQLAGSSGGTFKTEHELVLDKQKQRKARSRMQFINDELPKLKGGLGEKRHFEKKFKGAEKKDHEKM